MGAHYDCCDQDWRTSHVIALFPGQVGNTGICRLFTGKYCQNGELDEGTLKMIHDINLCMASITHITCTYAY